MEKTTDLNILRKHPNRFTWGDVTAIHDIGRYTFVEATDWSDFKTVFFHVYVDGKSNSRSSHTLEQAMVLAIALAKFNGSSHADHMSVAACKVLDLLGCPSEETNKRSKM